MTGLVFGGFGTSDLFPSLYCFEFDGIYFDKPKIINRNSVNVDRNSNKTQIKAFAQKEMVERFINGADDEYIGHTANFLGEVVDKIFKRLGIEPSSNFVQEIKQDLITDFYQMSDRLKEIEEQSIRDIVNFMSKKELAEMAHALVELTSAKRRFSTDQETVGGPIDVAVVSRSEGLIWIRRKNYFERDMNPGFFHRVFPPAR